MKPEAHPHTRSGSGYGVVLCVVLAIAAMIGIATLGGIALVFMRYQYSTSMMEEQKAADMAEMRAIEAMQRNRADFYRQSGSSRPSEAVAVADFTASEDFASGVSAATDVAPPIRTMIRIVVDADGEITLDGDVVDQQSLDGKLIEKAGDPAHTRIVIAADPSLTVVRIVKLFDACRKVADDVALQSLPPE